MMQQQHVPTIFLTRPMITSCDPDVLSVIVRQFDCPDGMASYDGVVSLLKTCQHFYNMKDMSWLKELLKEWYYRRFRTAMNREEWPTCCGGRFSVIPFNWKPPSSYLLRHSDTLKKLCNCDNQLCVRYAGNPDKNLPMGVWSSILEDPFSLAYCKLSTSYCKKCYMKEVDRSKKLTVWQTVPVQSS